MNSQDNRRLARDLDEALDSASTPEQASAAQAPELRSLVALARRLAEQPKAPAPSASFVADLGARLAARPVAAALEAAAHETSAAMAGLQLDLELEGLGQALAALPKAPAPSAAFRGLLAQRLAELPAPRSLEVLATAATSVQPTQEILQLFDQSLEAMVAGRTDVQEQLRAALAQDPAAAAELGGLLALVARLRELPQAPGLSLGFRQALAQALHRAPWPRSLPRRTAAAPWSWLAAFWRSTAATAAAAAAILLFLVRGHLPSHGPLPAFAPERLPAAPALSARLDGPSAPGRLAPLRRQDPGTASADPTRAGQAAARSRPVAAAPAALGARTLAQAAPPAPGLLPSSGPEPAQAQPAEAPPAPAEDEERGDEEEREDEDPAPAIRPQPTLQPPVEPPPSSPVPSEQPPAATAQPVTPQPSAPPPTAPVIPANQPPRILGLHCTPDQVEEAGSAECRVEVEDDGGQEGLHYSWTLQGVGPELSGDDGSIVTFTASGNGGGLSWLGEFVLLVVVRDAEGLEVQGRTQVTIRPAQP